MLKIIFNDKTEIEVLENTTVYPSGSSTSRSYAEIHLAEDAMSLADLETLFKDETKTASMHFVLENEGTVIFDQLYENFVLLTSCGKRLCQEVNATTGTVTESMHLVVRLEQPTYNEQLVRDIQKAYNIILEGE